MVLFMVALKDELLAFSLIASFCSLGLFYGITFYEPALRFYRGLIVKPHQLALADIAEEYLLCYRYYNPPIALPLAQRLFKSLLAEDLVCRNLYTQMG